MRVYKHSQVHGCRSLAAAWFKLAIVLIDALEAFYIKLFDGASDRTAAVLARALHSKLRAITFQRRTDADTQQSMAHIRQIAAAIRNRNADAAAAACLTQVRRSWKVAQQLLDRV